MLFADKVVLSVFTPVYRKWADQVVAFVDTHLPSAGADGKKVEEAKAMTHTVTMTITHYDYDSHYG